MASVDARESQSRVKARTPEVERVLEHVDLARAVSLVQEVCRVPSVLGDEKALAQLLVETMRESRFEDVALQPVLPDRPNALGQMSFGAGRRVVMTGHMDTKPESIGWTVTDPYSGDLIDGFVYGHGIMDMKAALACMIVAMEGVRASAVELEGTVAFAAVSDHMGDQKGSIAYFAEHPADLCVLGELSDNEIFIGHRGRYYFDVTAQGRSAHTCHKHLAVNANVLAAHTVIALDDSRLEPRLEPWSAKLFGPETFMAPGRIYGGLSPGGPSMVPDECVIRVDCRPQPGVTVDQVRDEIDRCVRVARESCPDLAVTIELVDVKDAYVASPEAEVVQLMTDAVRDVRGTEPELFAAGWLGDTASFGKEVPTVIFGPGGEPVYCADERLSVDDIHEATRVYASWIARALQPGSGPGAG